MDGIREWVEPTIWPGTTDQKGCQRPPRIFMSAHTTVIFMQHFDQPIKIKSGGLVRTLSFEPANDYDKVTERIIDCDTVETFQWALPGIRVDGAGAEGEKAGNGEDK